ncbi:DUF5960 family protein [Enterococcus sp. DIV2163]|uniref:DUF5960 family protein n=1 Tax=Enterococcus sp. DIV2163 TaxID=2774834 RepID=UPI003D2FEDBE
MRNKEQFLTDYNEVVKPEIQNDETVVEDAAHTLNHSAESVFIVPAEFTKTNKDEKFVFEQKEREKPDNPDESMLDWFYKGRGGE